MLSGERDKQHRILVIDDNPAIHDDFRKILMKTPSPDDGTLVEIEADLFGSAGQTAPAAKFQLDFAFQGQEGLEMAKEAHAAGWPYALAFVDSRIPPGWDGIETISRLWQVSPELQVVFCTAYADFSWQEIQDILGERDNLLILKKPFDNIEVLQLAYALTRKWEQNHEIQTRLNQLAYFDSLTALPNRTQFIERLNYTLDLAQRYQQKAALLFIDLDNFKRINDTLGHSRGDDLLKEIARRIVGSLRASDTVTIAQNINIASRLGGDEFTVILSELNRNEDAGLVAERITEQIDKPIFLDGHQVVVTPCIGIAIYPEDGDTAEKLLKNADIAMYYAKRNSPRTYSYYQESMNTSTLKQLTLESHLRRAMERGELSLNYQPQIDLETGRIVGVEALLRWKNWEYGNVPPSEFIPIAEGNGLIIPIGNWILRTACQQAKDWLDQGLPLERIAINASINQFTHSKFLETVRMVLADTGLDPQRLEIEITESLMAKDLKGTSEILQMLQEMRVQIAIDDFGTGYSSLNHLKNLPITHLKIDRTFISGIGADIRDQSIISAILVLAESMGLKVIAEGVETRKQLAFLRENQCQEAQGFLFSHPLPTEQIEALLRQSGPSAGYTRNIDPEPSP